MHFWSPCFGLVKGTNRTPSHDSRYLLSKLQVPHAQCFKAFFHLLQVSCHRSRGFNVPPQQKRAYSALHPQALTECSPWISEDRLLTIFTTSGNAWARVSFRKHGSASGRVYGSDKTAERNQNIFFFLNTFYSRNCQNTEISVCTFQSPYKYGRTFTHVFMLLCSHGFDCIRPLILYTVVLLWFRFFCARARICVCVSVLPP